MKMVGVVIKTGVDVVQGQLVGKSKASVKHIVHRVLILDTT